jgi:hypothetical protein
MKGRSKHRRAQHADATTSDGTVTPAAYEDSRVREIINQFSVEKAEGPYKDFIRWLGELTHEFNQRHFEGSPPYLEVAAIILSELAEANSAWEQAP